MASVLNSFKNFLFGGDAPSVQDTTGQGMQYGNQSLDAQNKYAQGMMGNPTQGAIDQYTTGSDTGSKAATENVQGNSLLMGGLNAMKGQLGTGQGLQEGQTGILNGLQSQGYQLTPGDRNLYGQASGDIARQFGQQGNQAAASLASRGLSNSGAAGATFSGLAGNQNEMLAKAQQQIMQQRFQNTIQQIGQQQNFINSLNSQNNQAAGNYHNAAAGDIQNQYQRQLAGAQNTAGQLSQAAQNTTQGNSANNAANLQQYNTLMNNTPMNIGDFITAGAGQGLQSGLANGPMAAYGMGGGGGSAPNPVTGPGAKKLGGGPMDNMGMGAGGGTPSMFA